MLLRHTLLYLPAQILAPAIQFVSILVWAYWLSPVDIGIVTLAVAIQELCFAGFFMWWSHYALRYIKSYKGDDARLGFLGAELFALAISTVAQIFCLLPFLWLYFSDYVTPSRLAILIVFMLSRSLSNYIAERVRSEAQIVVYSIIQLGMSVGGFVVGLAFMYFFSKSAEAVLGGFCVAQVLSAAAGLGLTDIGRGRIGEERGIMRKAAAFGFPVMAASILSLVSLNAPRFIVDNMLGISAVGMFAIGYGLGLRASSFAVMLVTAGAYPLVVKKMETEGLQAAYAQLRTNMMLVGLVVLPVALGLLALNASVTEVLVAAPFRDVTALVLPLSTLAGLFRYLRSHTTDQVFLIQARPAIITWFGIVDLILTLTFSYFGAKYFGLAGVAVGPVVAGLVIFLASIWFATRRFGFVFPYARMARALIAAVLMAVGVRALPVADSYLSLALLVAVGGILYVVLVPLFLPVERRLIVEKFLSRRKR